MAARRWGAVKVEPQLCASMFLNVKVLIFRRSPAEARSLVTASVNAGRVESNRAGAGPALTRALEPRPAGGGAVGGCAKLEQSERTARPTGLKVVLVAW